MVKLNIDNFYDLDEILFREQLEIPSGWKEEVYYSDGEISFSSPMTRNSWTDSEDKIGVINSISLNDFDGIKVIDNDIIIVGYDDEDNEVINRDEAIDRIVSNYADDNWNYEIKFKLKEILGIDEV